MNEQQAEERLVGEDLEAAAKTYHAPRPVSALELAALALYHAGTSSHAACTAFRVAVQASGLYAGYVRNQRSVLGSKGSGSHALGLASDCMGVGFCSKPGPCAPCRDRTPSE